MMAHAKKNFWGLTAGALGVVYGDIGTSPLYALRVSLSGLPINEVNVFGVLSLIFWALIFIVSVKYLMILLRADNNGEGGILALLALIKRSNPHKTKWLLIISVLGSGLVFGDGMLTPAISVLSAVEGLALYTTDLSYVVLPLTIAMLLGIFYFQSKGTGKIGFIFGPILLLWFLVIGFVGLKQIIAYPEILAALHIKYAILFFVENKWTAYLLLGGVFLVLTGGEALYADLGHFGRKPIQITWFTIVLPALILNYFGQGVYVLHHPEALSNPFYALIAPEYLLPMIILATCATVIASQAVISATFSLTKQAILLGFYPHIPIIQTSQQARGQIYIPQINHLLAIGTILLVLIFKSSDALADAYGIAVNGVMLFTSILIVELSLKNWSVLKISLIPAFCIFIATDLAFLGANLHKIATGGWLPMTVATLCAVIMLSWYRGRQYLYNKYHLNHEKHDKLLRQLFYKKIQVLHKSSAVFVTDIYDHSGGAFLRFLKTNCLRPERTMIVNYVVHNVPRVSMKERFNFTEIKDGIYRLTLTYGFMDTVSVPESLEYAQNNKLLPFDVDVQTLHYFIEGPTVVAARDDSHRLFFILQKHIFAFLVRNYSAHINIAFYQLPYDRTIAIGSYYVL
jgi:KUP system potassium uptake protein